MFAAVRRAIGVFDRRQTGAHVASLDWLGHSRRQLIMPTDLEAVSRRKRAAQADAQTTITLMSVCLIIYLATLALMFEIYWK